MIAMIIRELRITDMHSLHKMYDLLSEENKLFFYPGFLRYENIGFWWLLSQIALFLSSVKFLRKMLLHLSPYFVFLTLVVSDQNNVVGFAFLKITHEVISLTCFWIRAS
jgi:hypothetical protein